MPAQIKEQAQENETYRRLTAAEHLQTSHFSQHEKIEGYFENRDVPDFMGSDRLLRIDTAYGTIQLGYHPMKGQSFLFANIKTSIFDTSAARYQKELKEYQMMRAMKTQTPNMAYSAKRREQSAVILYKADNLPWSRRTVAPYLDRAHLGALKKTMPFLDLREEHAERASVQKNQRSLQEELRVHMARSQYSAMTALRARQTKLTEQENELAALIYRKETKQRLFFRRLHSTFDLQKQEIFEYYRNRREKSQNREHDPGPVKNTNNEEDDD